MSKLKPVTPASLSIPSSIRAVPGVAMGLRLWSPSEPAISGIRDNVLASLAILARSGFTV